MQITSADIIAIVEIALVLFASSFALLLPLYAYLKNFSTALKVCIPLSISCEILVGYVFYTFGQIKIFPLVYLALVLLVNIVLAIRLKLFKEIKKIRIEFNWKTVLLISLVVTSIIYTRFYDGAKNIAPGAIDAASHVQYILDLILYGKLNAPYYAPGFHILVYPISQIADMVEMYRFTGPVLGIIILLSAYLLFKNFFKNKLSLYFLVLAFGLPIFSILTLQIISFFPAALTFIFLPMLIYILIKPKGLPIRKSLAFYAVTMFALALTVPYLLVQFIPAIILLNLIVLISTKTLGRKYLVFITKMLAVSLLGFVLAFGHVYLQSTLAKIDDTRNFPQITIPEQESSGFVATSNLEKTSHFLEQQSGIIKNIGENKLVKSYIIPMVITGEDAISIKNIRPLNGILSAAVYLWIIISLLMIYLSIRKKDLFLLVFGSFILVFGVATQTGILEMSLYGGRSGWYLLLLVLLASIYFLDMVIKRIPRGVSYLLLAMLITSSFLYPPVFYRGYFTEYYSKTREISRRFSNQKILLITDMWRIAVVSKNFSYVKFEPSSIKDSCDFDQCFLIFENKFFDIDPVKSQKALSTDKDQKDFKAGWAELKKTHEQTVEAIKKSQNFSKYKIYWENENISIYRFE